MRKLYEKNEILFAILWIVAYCVILGTLRGNFGDESIFTLIALIVFAAASAAFVKTNHLEGKYGLAAWPKDTKKYLFFIPMWILATGNLWGGVSPSSQGAALVFPVLSMILVGYVEEIIFRGFLFRAMLLRNRTAVAVTVSAVTFGAGHIINLLTGQAGSETLMQILFAIGWGFILTLVCLRSGSMIPCIIAHSLIDAFSKFAVDNELSNRIYVIATIVVAILYSLYLARLKEPESPGAH